MPTKKNSTSKKQKKSVPAKGAENTTATEPATIKFKEWRIEKLADIADVDKDQMDKVLYFLGHSLRKCRILNQTLVAMNYHEQGRITLETIENDKQAAAEVDPLA